MKDGVARKQLLLSTLPSVARTLQTARFGALCRRYGTPLVTDLLRSRLADLRGAFARADTGTEELRRASRPGALAAAVDRAARAMLGPSPRRVINATGVVVHTNLGRSILGPGAARRVAEAAQGYMDLEYDLEAAGRGSRMAHLAPLFQRLFPGHGFLAVNNNAAAVMLMLRTLASGKEVIVSRGELVEIGGSFRVPDIMAASGAKLVEIGTTNRTRLADYRKAINKKTGMLLKVHTSNFKIVGFSEETGVKALAGLARERGVPLCVDWGSGDLVDLEPLGIRDEQPIGEILDEGADLVSFSGDKLLGGPQAGILVGRPDLVKKLRAEPLARALRLDRLMIAALHETLSSYVRGAEREEVPTLRMLGLSPKEIEERARAVISAVEDKLGSGARRRMKIEKGVSRTGGGSSPIGERPTKLLVVSAPKGQDAGAMEEALRLGDPPVVGRVQDHKLVLDLRTVQPDEDTTLVKRLIGAMS
ncbi:hypothetical protein ABI59_06045 [Acidobacteria bacterium Mor1]|nr:hypothetical protein ABI59_06045 [Acidobacteria bacterium Mor1]